MGVKTIGLTEKKGGLAGALIVREHHELVFISQNGMVQRTGVKGISQQGRPAQGVRVMNLREDDVVSAVALVMETTADTGAAVEEDLPEAEPADGAEAPEVPDSAGRAGGRWRREAERAPRPRTSAAVGHARSRGLPRLLQLGSPGKGGGPNLSDSLLGTLEVSGR